MGESVKKKVRKRKTSAALTPKSLIPADYNPRAMDAKAKSGLKKSMDEFKDISGITWNKTTGNIVTGHHRWENLCSTYTVDGLVFEKLTKDKYSINTLDNEDTGYILRVVEWAKSKEKAANISANSAKIEGVFTVDLKDILQEIETDIGDDLFKDLRLDDLLKDNIHFTGTEDDEDWSTDIAAVEKVEEDDHQTKFSAITVTCQQEDKDRVLNLIEKTLNGIEVKIA